MQRRQTLPPLVEDLGPRSIPPLSELWSIATSDIASVFGDDSSTTSVPESTAKATPISTPKPSVLTTTSDLTMPGSTVTKGTTVLQTSFVTVPSTTTHVVTPISTSSDALSTPSQSADSPQATTYSSELSAVQSSQLTKYSSDNQRTTPPAFATGSSPSTTSSPQPLGSASSTADQTGATANHVQKHALIGGLAGTIAFLVLVGLLLAFIFLRKRRREDDDESVSEKGLRPTIARKWTQLTSSPRHTPRPIPPVSARSSTPDFEGGLIRVSLDNWPRPFAHGEGMRESMGPGRLRVMNPDPSRPTTPLTRPSTDTAGSFLRKQREALTAVLLGGNRSRASSRGDSPQRSPHVPSITIDPMLSSECVAAPSAAGPYARSHHTNSALSVVQQQPPEDPFLTPPDERLEDAVTTPFSSTTAAGQHSPRRPSIAPLQSAGRTLSHLGSALNPFRTRSDVGAESGAARTPSQRSVGTFSSAGDCFHLDRDRGSEEEGRGWVGSERSPRITVYEGT